MLGAARLPRDREGPAEQRLGLDGTSLAHAERPEVEKGYGEVWMFGAEGLLDGRETPPSQRLGLAQPIQAHIHRGEGVHVRGHVEVVWPQSGLPDRQGTLQ